MPVPTPAQVEAARQAKRSRQERASEACREEMSQRRRTMLPEGRDSTGGNQVGAAPTGALHQIGVVPAPIPQVHLQPDRPVQRQAALVSSIAPRATLAQPVQVVPQLVQTRLNPERGGPFAFMRGAVTPWTNIQIHDQPYVPPIASFSDRQTGKEFAPLPSADVLALSPPCGRGKSTAFHGYMDKLFERQPAARILLLSANILYGTNLSADLSKKYSNNYAVNVGFYKKETDGLQEFNVVVCSLESIHRLDEQQFDAILIDEIRSIARLVGGGTMLDFGNVYVISELCARASEVVVCDADLTFKIDQSEHETLVADFLRLIMPGRPVLHAELTHPGPDHLWRGASITYDCKLGKQNPGKKAWFQELQKAADGWHKEKTKRFAITCGTKAQVGIVYNFLQDVCKVPVKPYHGETNQKSKWEDLADPASAWFHFGCIATTTSLSIGVDPKDIEFDRVFMWTHPMGCNLLAMFQAAMRFGRQVGMPLGNMTVCILAKCLPPGERQKREREGKLKPTVRPTYEEEYTLLGKRRGAMARAAARELAASGGRSVGVGVQQSVSDQIMRTWAHSTLERKMQQVDHHFALMRCISHYGWQLRPEQALGAELSFEGDIQIDDDDEFAAGLDEKDKYAWAIEHVKENGEGDFFHGNCYDLAAESEEDKMAKLKAGVMLTGREQFLLKVYYLLIHVQRLPELEELMHMAKPGVLEGLRLNAYLRCMDKEAVQRADAVRRNDKGLPHPMLKPAVGMRMVAAEELGELVDLRAVQEGGELPLRIIEVMRRHRLGEPTDADDKQLCSRLKALADQLDVQGSAPGPLQVLRRLATACGMELEEETEKIPHPKATAKDGRIKVVKSLSFSPLLPGVVDDWKLHSRKLGYSVATGNWRAAHAAVEEDEMRAGMQDDGELDPELFAPPTGSGEERIEKIDSAALKEELGRLRGREGSGWQLTDDETRRLQFLEAIDREAGSEVDGTRQLTVVYGKRRTIGRLTASFPSMQSCPSGLRPLLVGQSYRDIDIVNCHPVLKLQVARKMGVDTPKLQEYVDDRAAMPQRIADHFGVPATKAKFAVLRVLNLGWIEKWIKDAECTRGHGEAQPDLRDLQEEARGVQEAFFKMDQFKDVVAAMTAEMKDSTAAAVRTAEERQRAASANRKDAAQLELANARRKASAIAIKRSVFSSCCFQLEDSVLGVVDEHFRESGWTVASLIFDGLLLEDKQGADLAAMLRTAEAAVDEKLGYKISLLEKPLFRV